MKKNDKYLKIVIFCYPPVLSSKEWGVDGGLNSIFAHIFTNIYSKIRTGFYFAFSSLAMQPFTILYFGYL